MAVEVMAWNVLDAFSDPGRARGVLEVVQADRPDVAVFSEAWRESEDHLVDGLLGDLSDIGYTAVHGLYDDNDGRLDRHGILGIVRNELVADQKPQLISLGSRNAAHIPFIDEASGAEIDFFGAHLDDRSEKRRLAQASQLVARAGLSERAVIGGDFNAMYRNDRLAKVLRPLGSIAQRLPTVDPRPDFKPPKLQRFGSLASRLTAMATGTTMQQFEAAGFEDADPERQPTKGPFALDHIVVRGLEVTEQRTHPKSPLSDHRALSVHVAAR